MIIRRTCSRCRAWLWMTQAECENNPRQVVCDDCSFFLRTHPDVAEREFQAEQARADADSLAMRARWAAQDARKRGEVA